MSFKPRHDFDPDSSDSWELETDILRPEFDDTPRFVADFALFHRLGSRLLSTMLNADEDMEEFTFYDNTIRSPFREHNIYYMVLKSHGLRIAFAEQSADSSLSSLRVLMHAQDRVLYSRTSKAYRRQSIYPATDFLRHVTDGTLSAFHLDPKHLSSKAVTESIASTFSADNGYKLDEERVNVLVRRGFMTSSLLKRLDWSTTDGINRHFNESSVAQGEREYYEALYAEGLRPLAGEELYGMVNGLALNAINRDPEIAEEFRKRREEKARGNDLG